MLERSYLAQLNLIRTCHANRRSLSRTSLPASSSKEASGSSAAQSPEESKHPKVWKGKVYMELGLTTRSRWETGRGVFTCFLGQPGRLISPSFSAMGWAVCSVDVAQIHATDLLDDRVTSSIKGHQERHVRLRVLGYAVQHLQCALRDSSGTSATQVSSRTDCSLQESEAGRQVLVGHCAIPTAKQCLV